MEMVTDPPIGRDGRRLLQRARLFISQNGRAYPLSLAADVAGADRAVAGGYARRVPGDRHFVWVTTKGEAYLDRLMRCE